MTRSLKQVWISCRCSAMEWRTGYVMWLWKKTQNMLVTIWAPVTSSLVFCWQTSNCTAVPLFAAEIVAMKGEVKNKGWALSAYNWEGRPKYERSFLLSEIGSSNNFKVCADTRLPNVTNSEVRRRHEGNVLWRKWGTGPFVFQCLMANSAGSVAMEST